MIATADYVRNLAYDRNEIQRRTGQTVVDRGDSGYLGKLTVGYPRVRDPGDWQAFIAYRKLESDAVPDAFTDSDFGLGGTNNKGYIVGLSYGLARNTSLSLKYLSAKSLAPYNPDPLNFLGNPVRQSGNYAVDVLQLDLSARF